MNTLVAAIVGLYGLLIGSFINALVWRLHERKGIARGERSMCPRCQHQLGVLDLIPVLSWIGLRGKCRYCHKPISISYPVVELLTALLFVFSYLRLAPHSVAAWFSLIIWFYIIAAFVALALYDARWEILPDTIVLPSIVVVALGLLAQALLFGLSWGTVGRHAVAAVALGGGFYLLASLAGGRLMGGGDVKLGFLMGLILGLRGTVLAAFIAFDSAAIIAIVLIALKLRKRSDHIAFGPFLILGTLVAYLYGHDIITWYLQLNGLK